MAPITRRMKRIKAEQTERMARRGLTNTSLIDCFKDFPWQIRQPPDNGPPTRGGTDMSTPTAERIYEKRELPPDKPILFRLDAIKEAKPVTNPHSGKQTQMVSWLLRVDDRKYPEHNEYTVFHRTNAWCAQGGNGNRATGSYTLIETLLGPEEAQFYDRTDLQRLLLDNPEELKSLLNRHVVGWMKPMEQGADGKLWQNPKEFKHPDELEWDLEARRMDADTMRKHIGMPKAKTPPKRTEAAQTPTPPPAEPEVPDVPPEPEAPAQAQPRTTTREPSRDELLTSMKDMLSVPGALRVLAKRFLAQHKAEAVSKLDDKGLQLLYVLLMIQEQAVNGGVYQQAFDELLTHFKRADILELTRSEADLINHRLLEIALGDDVPF